ncbi:MAG: cupin domain-containing protein [Isosphaeraceae bacterium]
MNMKTITVALTMSALAFLGGYSISQSVEDAPKPKARELIRQSLKEKVDGKAARVTLVEVQLPPGADGSPHRHPGPVIGYVLEGDVEIQVDDGPVTTYHTGETFYEPAMALHKVSRNPSKTKPARLLAYLLTADDVTTLVLPAD